MLSCTVCGKDIPECTCPDREQRMREASDHPNVAIKWCVKCDKAYYFCKCDPPDFKMRLGGELEELPPYIPKDRHNRLQ